MTFWLDERRIVNTSTNATIIMPPTIKIKGIKNEIVGEKVDAVGVKVGDDPISLSFYFPVWNVIVIYLKKYSEFTN